MVRLNWTEQAINDLLVIAEFISNDSVRYAKATVRKIRDKAKILIKYPNVGRIVPEINDSLIRELIMGNYRIIYTIVTDYQIDLIAIHHSARFMESDEE